MIARAIGYLSLLPFFAGVAWLAVVVADRQPPVTDAHVVIVPNEIEPGRSIQADVQVFYLKSCWTYVSRRLYDHTGAAFVAPELTLPPSQVGLVHSASTVPLPIMFAPGEGRLVSSPSYGCNWFQRWFWPIQVPQRVAVFYALPAGTILGEALRQERTP